MKVEARLNNLRIAPRKTRLVVDLIRGLDVSDALNQLDSTVKGGMLPIKKLLQSAVANGVNNFGIDPDNMYVKDIFVNGGAVLKRWMPKAYGRAGQILKRTSKIEIVLEERIEGKGRKTKEQLEKEKKSRMDAKKKLEKEAEKKEDKEEAEKIGKAEKKNAKPTEQENKSKSRGSWGSKIFRRKSM